MMHPRHCPALLALLALALPCAGADEAAPPAHVHSFLATGGKTYLMQWLPGEPQGKVTVSYPNPTREGWVLPGGNLLLAVAHCQAFPHGAAVEVTRELTEVWSYQGTQEEVNSIQKTAEGTYVLTEAGARPRLLELDASGKVVVEFALSCQSGNAHMETRMTRKLADGTYLCPHLLDFAVKHYDRTGKVLDQIDTTTPGDSQHKVESWPFTAIRLANGNTLVGLTHANRVAEYDPAGTVVWQLTNDDVGGLMKDACGVQRLPNGNTIVNSYAAGPGQVRLFEVTPGKKVVWTYVSNDGPGIHHMQVIDTDGVPLAGPVLR
jgi:hypothetical protein